jgi:hypothetical protein
MEPVVDAGDLAKAIGAKAVGKRSDRTIDILEVRHTLQTMVRSSGGRPGIAESKGQKKIPKLEADWDRVEELSNLLNVSAGQVAATVLHLGLAQITESEIRSALVRAKRR